MKNTYIITSLIVLAGCGKDNDMPLPPAKAILVFPAENEVCTGGNILSDSQSTVTFRWNTAERADSYELNIKNLLTQSTMQQMADTNEATITLLRNVPYSWFVRSISASSTDTIPGEIWKFYLPGPGMSSHAPFPATLISPAFGEKVQVADGKISLMWSGSDVDNDIANYDLYFGTATSPELLQANVSSGSLTGIAVMANTTYYWKVITRDQQGNTSVSDIYQFKMD